MMNKREVNDDYHLIFLIIVAFALCVAAFMGGKDEQRTSLYYERGNGGVLAAEAYAQGDSEQSVGQDSPAQGNE